MKIFIYNYYIKFVYNILAIDSQYLSSKRMEGELNFNDILGGGDSKH